MMGKEFKLLKQRLKDRGSETKFFTIANTIETINFRRTNQGHGWIGVRFQLTPESKPNDCIMHIRLHDQEPIWQQQVIGICGVNMLYACYNAYEDIDQFLQILMQNISPGRIEVDFLQFSGPDFTDVDNRLLALKLVKNGLTDATMFGPDGNVLQPEDVLYKKNVLLLRGRFRPVTKVNTDMIRVGLEQFSKEEDVDPKKIQVVYELTLNALTDPDQGHIDDQDFLDRVDTLSAIGQTVLISNYQEYYRIVSYLYQYTRKRKVGVVLSTFNLEDIFNEKYYTHLHGGILEAFGTLFGANVKMYVYPTRLDYAEILYTGDNFELPPTQFSLFRYLFDNHKIEDLTGADTDLLHISPKLVLNKIQQGETDWENMVPSEVVDLVKSRGMFGHKDLVSETS